MTEPMTTDETTGDVYFVRKNGYYYRPNSRGYTSSPWEAGRYSKEDAEIHIDERAGVSIVRASEVMPDMLARKSPDGLREKIENEVRANLSWRVTDLFKAHVVERAAALAKESTDRILALVQPAVKVKALEWGSHFARTPWGVYRTVRHSEKSWRYVPPCGFVHTFYPTEEAAKAAAQAHYENAIREALEPCASDSAGNEPVSDLIGDVNEMVPDGMVVEGVEKIDRLAEAGLCQMRAPGKHEFLKDIRRKCEELRAMLSAAPTEQSEEQQ